MGTHLTKWLLTIYNKWHMYIYNIYDMENRILVCYLTCIICRGLSHENENLNFISHLTSIFTMCMFLTSMKPVKILPWLPLLLRKTSCKGQESVSTISSHNKTSRGLRGRGEWESVMVRIHMHHVIEIKKRYICMILVALC